MFLVSSPGRGIRLIDKTTFYDAAQTYVWAERLVPVKAGLTVEGLKENQEGGSDHFQYIWVDNPNNHDSGEL